MDDGGEGMFSVDEKKPASLHERERVSSRPHEPQGLGENEIQNDYLAFP
jgi:hypothetical protein